MQFSALYQKYDGLAEPIWALTVNGVSLKSENGAALQRMVCSLTCRQEAGCLTLEGEMNPKKQMGKAWLNALQLGAVCSLSLGYKEQSTEVFVGYLEEVVWDAPDSDGAVAVEAVFLDVRGRLMKHCEADAGTTRTLSEMVNGILQKTECTKFAPNPTIQTPPKDWNVSVRRDGSSDYAAICAAASFLCYEFYACADELYFGPARSVKTTVVEFNGLDGLQRLRRRRTLSGQCAGVTVRGTDATGERISYRQARTTDSGYGMNGVSGFLTKDRVISASSAHTMAQIQYLAQARMKQIQAKSGGLLGWCTGLPELRPGRFIKVSSVSEAVNGTYYVHSVRHTFDAISFETYFETEES